MTDQTNPRRLELLRQALPDLVGVLGFGLLTRGLWLWFGEPVALTVVGTLLMILGTYAAVRGGR
jgi:hypothetical protein